MFLVTKVGDAQRFSRKNSSTGESFTRTEYPITLHPFQQNGILLEISWDTQFTFWTPSKAVANVLRDNCWSSKSNDIAVLETVDFKRSDLKASVYKTSNGEPRKQIQATIWLDRGVAPTWSKLTRPIPSDAGNLFEIFEHSAPKEAPIAGFTDMDGNPFE